MKLLLCLSVLFSCTFCSAYSPVSKDEIIEHKRLLRHAVEELTPYPTGVYEGKGVVVCAGGVTYLLHAWVHLNRLRQVGCALPAELWYYGEEEICPDFIEAFAEIDVECRDLKKMYPGLERGYVLKPFAIAASKFEEVILLDADNHPLHDPTFLFESPEYLQNGAIFWPDLHVLTDHNPIWFVTDLSPLGELSSAQESGQLVINKKQCWGPLQIVLHMNTNHHFYYKFLHGDKDTFQFSWRVLNAPFFMIPYYPGLSTTYFMKQSKSFLQRSIDGTPLFHHVSMYKDKSVSRHYCIHDTFYWLDEPYTFFVISRMPLDKDKCVFPDGTVSKKGYTPSVYSFYDHYPEAMREGANFLEKILLNEGIEQWINNHSP